MEHAEAKRDLEFIKGAVERATHYTNIPLAGYLLAGVLALAGTVATYWRLGWDPAAPLQGATPADHWVLGAIWLTVLLLAILGAVATTRRLARRRGTPPWDALAARLFLSQGPQVLVAGLLTCFLAGNGLLQLVPALWLLHYGLIVFSFSYFTVGEHRFQSAWFLALGLLALFGPNSWSVPLLGLGFGVGHLLFGAIRYRRCGSS